MKGLSVLSFGFTRGLWEGEGAEDFQRMMGYAKHLDEYVIVANSYKRHGLKPRRLAPNVEAIPTDAFCFADSFFRMLRIGARVLRERRIGIVQAQDPFFTGLAAALLGWRYGLPVNVCVYGPNVFDPHWLASHWSHPLLARIGRWVLRRASGIQVDGKMTARSLIDAGFDSERVHVKPMVPANLDRFLTIERDAREIPRVLFAGRLALQKNLPLLIDAARLLHERGRRFELLIVGDGPDEPRLRAHAANSGLNGAVQFRPAVSRDEIADVFASADVFALSSDYEGYPRVLMEAAAAALPIVTTAVSGSDEAIADGVSGSIVPVGDTAAFVEKLDALLGDAALRTRMGTAARAHARARLDPTTNTPAQLAIWRAIVEIPGSIRVPRVGKGVPPSRTFDDIQSRQELHARGTRRGVPWGGVLPGPSAAESSFRRDAETSTRDECAPRTPRSARIRNLLLFNLTTDTQHPILGFTTQWIRALAARCETVHVITMLAGEIDVPANVRVHSVGREHGYSEPRRLIEFYRHLFRILRAHRIDGCFSHMMPVFSALAGPVLRLRGIPLVTWYAHPSLTPTLKLAHFASHRMVTSLPTAYPYRKDKLTVIGQGIDTALFAPGAALVQDRAVLCVGRISPVKDHPTLLHAVAKIDCRLAILGATAGAEDEKYLAHLHRLVSELGISHRVTFVPSVPPAELPAHYSRCDLHVNLTPVGFGDKVAWEAMSCARPCLVANDDFRETLGDYPDDLLFKHGDAEDLAKKLTALLSRSEEERAQIGEYLRAQVERLHSLPALAGRILAEVAAARPRA